MIQKLDQLKTPNERVLDLAERIHLGELECESISINRFTSENGKEVLQVELELVAK
jgi:hypothetical protein